MTEKKMKRTVTTKLVIQAILRKMRNSMGFRPLLTLKMPGTL